MNKKKLPIDIQDFPTLIRDGHVYVDKTEAIHRLVSSGTPSFFCRPHRFGKSLLISTIEAIFKNQRELFKGLWIDRSDYGWQEHPVIRLNMGDIVTSTPELFESSLLDYLKKIAESYGVICESDHVTWFFAKLIDKLAEKYRSVVVLVDDYDKPLLDTIEDADLQKEIYQRLIPFYEVLKYQGAQLGFVLLTGMIRFSLSSVFSGLNHLDHITLCGRYDRLLGYTQEELEQYFGSWIEVLSKKHQTSVLEIKSKIKHWYGGYQFSYATHPVYNPYSVLNLFEKQVFSDYWFSASKTEFLIKSLGKKEIDSFLVKAPKVWESTFSMLEMERMNLLAWCYQSGYLTVKKYEDKFRAYTLDFPNFELKNSFLDMIMIYLSENKEQASCYLTEWFEAFRLRKWDHFFEILEKIILNISHDIQFQRNKFYETVCNFSFALLGANSHIEARTKVREEYAIIETPELCTVFVFKVDESADEALKQIHKGEYYQAYKKSEKGKVLLFGVNFSSETRAIEKWVKEENQ